MMIMVNPVFLQELVSPLIGGADSEDSVEMFAQYSTDSETDVKRLAREVLLPEFLEQKPVLKQKVKDTLEYYLTYPKIDFESIFNSFLLPLDTLSDSTLFFNWLWEVVFEGETRDYIVDAKIIEDFDANALLNHLNKKETDNMPIVAQ